MMSEFLNALVCARIQRIPGLMTHVLRRMNPKDSHKAHEREKREEKPALNTQNKIALGAVLI